MSSGSTAATPVRGRSYPGNLTGKEHQSSPSCHRMRPPVRVKCSRPERAPEGGEHARLNERLAQSAPLRLRILTESVRPDRHPVGGFNVEPRTMEFNDQG